MQTTPIILASQSSRRAEILSSLKVPFQVISSDFDERSIPYKNDSHSYVSELALRKAAAVAQNYPEAVIISADTEVFLEGERFGKPPNYATAVDFLHRLGSKWHSVVSGVSVAKGNQSFQASEETRVYFNPLQKSHIHAYLNAISWHDKSGGYAIQGAGAALLVAQIHGCFYNIMGSPVNTLQKLLSRVNIDLWKFFEQA